MSTSIHDHHIVEMNVNAVTRTLRPRTAYPERTGPHFADIVFEGVEGYALRGDALGTILFDIESVDAISDAIYAHCSGLTVDGGARPALHWKL